MVDSNKLELELNRGINFQKKGESLKAKNIYLTNFDCVKLLTNSILSI